MSTTSTSPARLAEAIALCRRQQQAWSQLPIRQQLRRIRAFRHLLVGRCDDLCAAVANDLGKPAQEVIGGEVLPLADACRFLEREAARLLRPRRVSRRSRPLWLFGQSDVVYHRPRGVVGIIGTWNYPLLLNGVQIVQALAAGNAVVWKPSEVVPASAGALFDLLEEAGFPAGLVHKMEATREAGSELAAAEIDHVVFTGSSAVGRMLAANLGRRLVSSTLELSGCDAMFLLDDADVRLAARAAWFGCSMNRGQTCLAVRRMFVPRPLYGEFVEALRPLVVAAPAVRLALPSAAGQARRLLADAVADGGRLLQPAAAAADGEEGLCSPGVVLDARPEMAVCREGSFAPVMAVLPYDTLDAALRMNDVCSYALGASIFTRNPARGARLAARVRAGTVAVNDVIVPTAHPATPFGGVGESGWGVTQGAEGLLELTVPQTVSVRAGSFRPHYDLVGENVKDQTGLVRGFLEWGHAPTWRHRWRGILGVVRGLWHTARSGN